MRPRMIVVLAILAALGAQPARAQFALSPRGIFGMMTRPLRDMLGHLRGLRYRHYRVAHGARHAGSQKPSDQQQAKLGDTETSARAGASPDAAELNAYDNVLGYAFWPDAYAGALDRYGYADITAAVIGPLQPASTTVGHAATTGANPDDAAGGSILPVCQNAGTSTTDWLTGKIEQGLNPNTAQLHRLDRLRARLAEGAALIKTSCQTPLSLLPAQRLADLRQRLWAVHEAGVLARHSIKAFYASLNPAQKAKFASTAQASQQRDRQCATQDAGDTKRLLEQIQQTVHVANKTQQVKLDRLRKTSAEMHKLLLAACAQPAAPNPLARLDAADQRLVATNLAATNMEVALNDFYGALDARQKKQFDALGR